MRKLFNYKKFSVLVIPEGTASEPRNIKISFARLITYIAVYSLFVFILGFYFISFTPLSEILFPYSLRLTDSDKKRVEILNEKVNFLATEIEALKSVNERMKFAIMLGDSNLLKEKSTKYKIKENDDSVKSISKIKGSVFEVVKDFLLNLFINNDDDIYFLKPVNGFVSNAYNINKGHYGIDFVIKENNPVYASAGGYVIFADYTPKFGFTMIINHKKNYSTKYMHCSSLLRKTGETVLQGEIIALSGNSGTDSSGPHLHFEIWKDGIPINPADLLINF